MSKLNIRVNTPIAHNHEGLPVFRKQKPEDTLRRVTLASMLFEDQFYFDGKSHVELIKELVSSADPKSTQALAVEARTNFKLRHIPMLLTRELARKGKLPAQTLTDVIQRPDEIGEFLAHYWSDGKCPLSNQVKKGIAASFNKFNEYQFAKWDKGSAKIALRDALFLTHPRPKDESQEALFKRIANKELVTPDTWEVALSGGADKKETFTRLMAEKKLGALAFLRNLRNMTEAGVSNTDIRAYGAKLDVSRVLPFRFLAAARVVPQYEDMLEAMMFRALDKFPKLKGKTAIVVDVSGSMFGAKVSAKSDLDRFDAAAALAVLCRELCEEIEIYSFSNTLARVPPRRGFALVDAIHRSQSHSGTDLYTAITNLNNGTEYDRCIVLTDEQSFSRPPDPKIKGYIINVAAYEHGIDNKEWVNINGFSEAVFDFIREYEV